MRQNFTNKLSANISRFSNPICFGMDPVLDLIPCEGSGAEKVKRFYLDILEEMLRRNVKPAAIKPNSAYYESISIDAIKVLQELITAYESEGILSILDAKRGDIGKSSTAYAQAAFDVFGASAVTVSPWMGADSVQPFLQNSGKGVFVLLRTSNIGAADFQDLNIGDGEQAFHAVANKLLEWNNGDLGAVVGATNPTELERITVFFVKQNSEIPFLIPGVSIPGVPGQQGGDAHTVMQALRAGGSKRNIHLLNSSSGLSYAWQVKGKADLYASATVDALERLCESIL
ncbi:MAG: orotidine-5'-phosphate decarboxylase [Fibrobacter sp.]|nr:orotidine-5'-phosphate decarboxylase [Fibrobacter sp.]